MSVEELMVAPEMVAPVIAPLALTERTSAVVAPLFPLASLIVPSGEDGTDRVKLLVAVADWPIWTELALRRLMVFLPTR